mgnify:CR=1 FL=1
MHRRRRAALSPRRWHEGRRSSASPVCPGPSTPTGSVHVQTWGTAALPHITSESSSTPWAGPPVAVPIACRGGRKARRRATWRPRRASAHTSSSAFWRSHLRPRYGTSARSVGRRSLCASGSRGASLRAEAALRRRRNCCARSLPASLLRPCFLHTLPLPDRTPAASHSSTSSLLDHSATKIAPDGDRCRVPPCRCDFLCFAPDR